MSKGSGSTRASGSSNPRGLSSPVASNQKIALNEDVPAGQLVKFAEFLDAGDRDFEGIVLEDRNNAVLVRDKDSNWTRVIYKDELVRSGVWGDDNAKIARFEVNPEDHQQIILSNGVKAEVRNSASRTQGRYEVDVIRNGRTEKGALVFDYKPTSEDLRNRAKNRMREYLKTLAR